MNMIRDIPGPTIPRVYMGIGRLAKFLDTEPGW